jgi:UDP-N-acetylmuramate: L-alanyl-gamma-D-glutamyl-meso-diaminopimelate ligase
MHIHILGICGTFMGSLAAIARELGHEVTGCDANVYPPMSTQLEQLGIELMPGYDPAHLQPHPDMVIVGNAMSRGNPCVEYMLDQRLHYTSGPQWLCDHVLQDRWVLAVAGTHGKTTTTAMLAWVLQQADLEPGFLIGGVPADFPVSARLGNKPFFVIEADEYDSAFFDKRSKFVHYRPRTTILNNLEFDHADIFDSLADIQKQFHHLVRMIPSNGRIIFPANDNHLEAVLKQGCWSETETVGFGSDAQWSATLLHESGKYFSVEFEGKTAGIVKWQHSGKHNVMNALATLAAARHVGVTPEHGIEGLNSFSGVKRRMELLHESAALSIYDDFAHHPTAIKSTLQGLRAQAPEDHIVAIIEPRSNTMRMGAHRQNLKDCTAFVNEVIWYQPEELDWDLGDLADNEHHVYIKNSIDAIISRLLELRDQTGKPCRFVFMSNGGFGNIQQQLLEKLK